MKLMQQSMLLESLLPVQVQNIDLTVNDRCFVYAFVSKGGTFDLPLSKYPFTIQLTSSVDDGVVVTGVIAADI